MSLLSPKFLAARLSRGLRRIHHNENGQGLVFAAITLLFLTYFAGAIYRVGYLSSQKMKVQNCADAAAYSMALAEANALSTLAWINEGMAAVHYQLMKYAIDVIVAAVDQEYILDPDVDGRGSPRRPDDWQPDPHYTPAERQAFKDRYQEVYNIARVNIPVGKQLLKDLTELQKQTIEQIPPNVLRAAVDADRGAAFAMTSSDRARRGAHWAALFPDYEGLDYSRVLDMSDVDLLDPESDALLKPEINAPRFGMTHGVAGALHSNDSGYPAYTVWFDTGSRPAPGDDWVNYYPGRNWWHNGRYFDIERTNDYPDRDWLDPVRRTFARMGRLYCPNCHWQYYGHGHLLEELGDRSDPVETGRGYEVGDTVLYMTSVAAFRDRSGVDGQPQAQNANNPYMVPFFIRLRGAHMEGNPVIRNSTQDGDLDEIYVVDRVDEATNTLHLRANGHTPYDGGLRQEIWIWYLDHLRASFYLPDGRGGFEHHTGEPLPCEYYQPRANLQALRDAGRPESEWYVYINRSPHHCQVVGTEPNEDYYWKHWPGPSYGRFLIWEDINGTCHKEFYPIYLRMGVAHYAYVQTRGPCWDTREIKMSQTPSDLDEDKYFYGATGYIYDPDMNRGQGGARACPTCGFLHGQNIYPGGDFDGDRKTDVQFFPWHVFYLQGNPDDIDELDFMDVRVFREQNEYGEVKDSDHDRFIGESDAYRIDGIDPPWVLTEEFFRWGRSVGLWMPKPDRDLILPSSWEPAWGYFAFASARASVRDIFLGRWVSDPADYLDEFRAAYPNEVDDLQTDQDARRRWLDSGANLYVSNWQARLVPARDVIKTFDAEEYGFATGLQLLLDRLIYGTRTYDHTGDVYNAVVNEVQEPSSARMSDVLAELLRPTDPDHHGMDITDARLEDRVHH